MRTKIILLTIVSGAIALWLSGCSVYAQDATTPPAKPYKQLGIDLWSIAKQVMPATNDIYTLSVGYGQNTSTHESIEAAMLSIVNTNETGISLVGGRIGSHWEYGGGAFSLGRTDTVPILGRIRESIGDGVIYDWETHDPANYAFLRVSKNWNIWKSIEAGIGGMADNRSNAKGVDWIVGAHVGGTF